MGEDLEKEHNRENWKGAEVAGSGDREEIEHGTLGQFHHRTPRTQITRRATEKKIWGDRGKENKLGRDGEHINDNTYITPKTEIEEPQRVQGEERPIALRKLFLQSSSTKMTGTKTVHNRLSIRA